MTTDHAMEQALEMGMGVSDAESELVDTVIEWQIDPDDLEEQLHWHSRGAVDLSDMVMPTQSSGVSESP